MQPGSPIRARGPAAAVQVQDAPPWILRSMNAGEDTRRLAERQRQDDRDREAWRADERAECVADVAKEGVNRVRDIDVAGAFSLGGHVAELQPGAPHRLVVTQAFRPQLVAALREMERELARDLVPDAPGAERIP